MYTLSFSTRYLEIIINKINTIKLIDSFIPMLVGLDQPLTLGLGVSKCRAVSNLVRNHSYLNTNYLIKMPVHCIRVIKK